MKFEVKKKLLSDAVNVVKTMTDALAATGAVADSVHVIAEGKTLKLRSVAGHQIVERTIREDIALTEEGSAPINPLSLQSALKVGGDKFTAAIDGDYLSFICGRSKGRIEVMTVSAQSDNSLDTAPKALINVPGFKSMLRAMSLKTSGSSNDRALHVDAKKRTVRGEATDSYRGVTVTAPIGGDEKIAKGGSFSIPAKTLDTLANLIDDSALIGFDENFFSVRAPGLFICMPQASTPPIDIAGDMGGMIADAQVRGTFVVSLKEVIESITDALSLSSDKDGSNFTVILSPEGGQMTGGTENNSVIVDFKIESTDATSRLKVQTSPTLLLEALKSYRVVDQVSIAVYDGLFTIDLPEATGMLHRQQFILPVSSVVEEALNQRRVAPAKVEAKEEEEAKPAKKAKAVKPVAPPPDEEDDEPAPPKKVTRTPLPVEEPIEAVDDEDEDEETFDDDE